MEERDLKALRRKTGPRPLTVAEAASAVFIDFEGTKTDAPSVLGAYFAKSGTFRQYVIDPELHSAVAHKSPRIMWPVTCASPAGALGELRRDIELGDFRVFSWSRHEQKEIERLLAEDPESAAFWVSRVEDAIPHAKAWKRRVHPDFVLPKKRGRGRHTLENYEGLVGFERHKIHGWGKTGKRIRAVRSALAKRGSTDKFTKTQKAFWTNLLIHNENDCRGMATVVAAAAQNWGGPANGE